MPTDFAALGVPEDMTRALAERGLTSPFPIQAATIPDALAGRDLCGRAPTGSGKTIAFGIPMVLRVRRSRPKHPKGLVLVPTRELATQVATELQALAGGEQRIHALYGGVGFEGQVKALRRGVDIIVACPGRLGDLVNKGICHLDDVEMAVVDEADRMADMGFLPDVTRLLDQTADDRQTLLFSATLDGAVDELVRRYQCDPVRHEMPEEDAHQGQVDHHFWLSERPGRVALTADIVRRTGSTIVFCRTRHGADRVAQQLDRAGVRAAAIHGARSQSQRERALASFHRGQVTALVATDVAARGIHVTGVECVIHFDLPDDPKDYVHRSGRTARAGSDGVVVSLVAAAQRKDATRLRTAVGVVGSTTPPAAETLGGPGGGASARSDHTTPAAGRGPAAAAPASASPSSTGDAPGPPRALRPSPPAARRTPRPRPSSDDGPRPARAERTSRPTSHRAADPAAAGRRWSARPDAERPRAGRDRSDAGRPGTDRAAERTRGERATAEATRTERPAATPRAPGAHKERPSGAARRKAKKATLAKAGIEPSKAKGRAARGSRSRSGSAPTRRG